MKNKILLTIFCLVGFSQFVAADTKVAIPKIGYANLEYILNLIPETKALETDYKGLEQQIRNNLGNKIEEFQEKLQTLQKGYETMSESVRKQKEAELKQLQVNLQQLELEAQESLNNKHVELLKPIYDKLQKAVKAVAKENGYTHIFNSDLNLLTILLYADEKYDVSDLVLKKLGVNPPQKASKSIDKKAEKKEPKK
jgi:outer membrane protein